jgi:hypothetical protein
MEYIDEILGEVKRNYPEKSWDAVSQSLTHLAKAYNNLSEKSAEKLEKLCKILKFNKKQTDYVLMCAKTKRGSGDIIHPQIYAFFVNTMDPHKIVVKESVLEQIVRDSFKLKKFNVETQRTRAMNASPALESLYGQYLDASRQYTSTNILQGRADSISALNNAATPAKSL